MQSIYSMVAYTRVYVKARVMQVSLTLLPSVATWPPMEGPESAMLNPWARSLLVIEPATDSTSAWSFMNFSTSLKQPLQMYTRWTTLPSRNVDGSCSSDTPSLCKPTKMRLFPGEFSILLFFTLGVCPHTQQVSSDERAADRDAMPHSSHPHSTNCLRVYARDYAFIHRWLRLLGTEMVWQCYQTLPRRPMTSVYKNGGEVGLATRD